MSKNTADRAVKGVEEMIKKKFKDKLGLWSLYILYMLIYRSYEEVLEYVHSNHILLIT